jgi:hypothetical protein
MDDLAYDSEWYLPLGPRCRCAKKDSLCRCCSGGELAEQLSLAAADGACDDDNTAPTRDALLEQAIQALQLLGLFFVMRQVMCLQAVIEAFPMM